MQKDHPRISHVTANDVMRTIIRASLVVFTSCQVFGQDTAAPFSVEVASVKPHKSGDSGMSLRPSSGGLTATNATLKFLMTFAFEIKDHQLSGEPGWLSTERYDIVAKGQIDHPTVAQNRQMLQALLADRFQLRLRREIKELPMYVLLVGRNETQAPQIPGRRTADQPDRKRPD
jgi:uncharacterized protein (TIGR03435 family)